MSGTVLPSRIAAFANELGAISGVEAVALAGSHATGEADTCSDWDLAVYYRGALVTDTLAAYGTVYPPGSWGRLMNGGGWLELDGHEVDVLLRDIDVVDHWTERARAGAFEVDALLGYVAGAPTYLLAAERAIGRIVYGALDPVDEFPAALAREAPPRWRFAAAFSLDYARMHAARGDVVAALASATKAILEIAHARLCARGVWVLNEKRLVLRAGLDGLAAGVTRDLAPWLDEIARSLA